MFSEKVMETFRNPKHIGFIKDADGIGRVGNPACLPLGSMVHANDEFVGIDLLKVNNRVLGHDGQYNRIERTISRKYAGEIIRIKNKLGVTYLTPEHEVLAVKVPKRWKYNYAKSRKTLAFDWYHAKDLQKGDLAVYPVLTEEKDRNFIGVDNKKKKFDFKSKNVPNKIMVNSAFLRLCGYYLAEGYLSDKTTKSKIGLTFNIGETDLADDVEKIVKNAFGIGVKKRTIEERKTLIVEINNVFVVRLFKALFGTGAGNKKIPHWMMVLPAEKQKSLLFGLWKGDGYFNTKRPRAGYSTISYQLAEQIKTLLLRQRIIPSIYTENAKNSKNVRHKKAYRIHIGERNSLGKMAKILKVGFESKKPTATDSWFAENRLFAPIASISKAEYAGPVYNLEMEKSKSFVTESLSVHNCGDIMWVYIKVKKDGGKEIIEDVKVKTYGCVAAIATASTIGEMAIGKTLDEALKISHDEIAKELGGLPKEKMHCSVLSQQGLKAAIEDYRNKKGKAD